MMADKDEYVDINEKPSTKRIEEMMRMRNLLRFVTKLYYTVLVLFISFGIAVSLLVYNNEYQQIVLAHQILCTAAASVYVIVLLIMCVCNSNDEMRVVTLLIIVFSTGAMVGFIGALQLMDISLSVHKGQSSTLLQNESTQHT
jgi:hypothetical protein